jgi:hypothetical protein
MHVNQGASCGERNDDIHSVTKYQLSEDLDEDIIVIRCIELIGA